MTPAAPSDDAVRAKAYDLWLAGGMIHGRDREDWLRAEDMLRPDERPRRSETDLQVHSAAGLMVGSMLDAAQLAVATATNALNGLFAVKKPEPKTEPKPSPSSSPDDARVDAERRLQVEADKRVRDAGVKVGKLR